MASNQILECGVGQLVTQQDDSNSSDPGRDGEKSRYGYWKTFLIFATMGAGASWVLNSNFMFPKWIFVQSIDNLP